MPLKILPCFNNGMSLVLLVSKIWEHDKKIKIRRSTLYIHEKRIQRQISEEISGLLKQERQQKNMNRKFNILNGIRI